MSDVERREPGPDRRAALRPGGRGGRRASDKVDKIACPHCGYMQSSVLPKKPTHAQQQQDGFWRRRKCGGCGREYPTQEVARPDVA